MFITIALFMGVLGHMSQGVPLENHPSSYYKQFFESRIVGGDEAPDGSAPHMAALVTGTVWMSLVCGGSIISKTSILTAAHCIFVDWNGNLPDTYIALVGSNTLYQGTQVAFADHRIHPDYDLFAIKNDIGVLFTRNPIEFNAKVSPIPLNREYRDVQEPVVVFGYGTTRLWGPIPERLNYLKLSTMPSVQCKAIQAIIGGPHIDEKLEICTFHSYGHGMCHGDSGSALISLKDKDQIGIVSWGWPCSNGFPDVFVRVSTYIKFIFQDDKI